MSSGGGLLAQNHCEVWPDRWAAPAVVGYLKIDHRPHLGRGPTFSLSKEKGKLRGSVKRIIKKLGV